MSRSRKKHAITGVTTARSEKDDKRIINRVIRHKVKSKLRKKNIEELENFLEPEKNEIMDKWNMSKDGKIWFDKKDKYYKKAIRK